MYEPTEEQENQLAQIIAAYLLYGLELFACRSNGEQTLGMDKFYIKPETDSYGVEKRIFMYTVPKEVHIHGDLYGHRVDVDYDGKEVAKEFRNDILKFYKELIESEHEKNYENLFGNDIFYQLILQSLLQNRVKDKDKPLSEQYYEWVKELTVFKYKVTDKIWTEKDFIAKTEELKAKGEKIAEENFGFEEIVDD